jgi:hypothetical protein
MVLALRPMLLVGIAVALALFTPAVADEVKAPPKPDAQRSYDRPFRSDVARITLSSPDAGPTGHEIEYKVRMSEGSTFIYSWTVDGLAEPDEFYFDLHGETVPSKESPTVVVVDYWKDTRDHANGALVAAIDGVHGWYFQNQSARMVTVTVRMSGFYDLVEPGGYGNEVGIVATPVYE